MLCQNKFKSNLPKFQSPITSSGDPVYFLPRKSDTIVVVVVASCVSCVLVLIDILFSWLSGFTLGDPQRLLHPTDSNGKICGVDETVKDRPNLFYFDLTRCADPSIFITGCPTPQVYGKLTNIVCFSLFN